MICTGYSMNFNLIVPLSSFIAQSQGERGGRGPTLQAHHNRRTTGAPSENHRCATGAAAPYRRTTGESPNSRRCPSRRQPLQPKCLAPPLALLNLHFIHSFYMFVLKLYYLAYPLGSWTDPFSSLLAIMILIISSSCMTKMKM